MISGRSNCKSCTLAPEITLKRGALNPRIVKTYDALPANDLKMRIVKIT